MQLHGNRFAYGLMDPRQFMGCSLCQMMLLLCRMYGSPVRSMKHLLSPPVLCDPQMIPPFYCKQDGSLVIRVLDDFIPEASSDLRGNLLTGKTAASLLDSPTTEAIEQIEEKLIVVAADAKRGFIKGIYYVVQNINIT